MVKESSSSSAWRTQLTTAHTKPKIYTPKQYTTTQSKNKKTNSTVNNSSTLNATLTETLDIDVKELYKNYNKLWLRFWKKKIHLWNYYWMMIRQMYGRIVRKL